MYTLPENGLQTPIVLKYILLLLINSDVGSCCSEPMKIVRITMLQPTLHK